FQAVDGIRDLDWSSDVCSSDLVRVWRWLNAGVKAVDMTPDGRWVLSAGSDERLRLWDAVAGKLVATVHLPEPVRGETDRLIYHRSEERRVGKECRVRWVAKEYE